MLTNLPCLLHVVTGMPASLISWTDGLSPVLCCLWLPADLSISPGSVKFGVCNDQTLSKQLWGFVYAFLGHICEQELRNGRFECHALTCMCRSY